jgi:hypothetical protein
VAALLVSAVAVGGWALSTGDSSPRGHIAGRYPRTPAADAGPQAHAYATPLAASRVAAALTGAWRPAARHIDATGIYLRYTDDIVVIRPGAGGTLILVEPTATAYPRYSAQLGGAW